jgi:dienelactone hydrolase
VQPLFIAQGANDPRVPQSEADQMVATIRSHGGEVWYFLARDEGHGFRRKSNRDHYNNAVALFLRTYLLSSPPSPDELLIEPPIPAAEAEQAPVEAPEEDATDEVDDAMHAPLEAPSQDSPEEPLDPVTEPPNGQDTLAHLYPFR